MKLVGPQDIVNELLNYTNSFKNVYIQQGKENENE